MSTCIVIKELMFSLWVCILEFKGYSDAGVYAIIEYDEKFGPYPYKVIHYGKASNFPMPGFFTYHPKYHRWIREADPQDLFISIYTMLKSSKQQRKAVLADLLSSYKPVCND